MTSEFNDFINGVRKMIDRTGRNIMDPPKLPPLTVHDRANEAREDYLATKLPPDLYKLMKEDIAAVWRLLESPIEQVAIFQLASENYGWKDWPIYAKVCRARGLVDHRNYPVQLIPQVEFGRYRVDFLFDLGERGLTAVECDGAEHHQDKARDEKRDKALKEQFGVWVLRLPGRDIWKNNHAAEFYASCISARLR